MNHLSSGQTDEKFESDDQEITDPMSDVEELESSEKHENKAKKLPPLP